MPNQEFAPQPYYRESDGAIVDIRILGSLGRVMPADVDEHGNRFTPPSGAEPRERTKLEYAASDGEDASGFVALHGLHMADGRKLAIVRSWQFYHDTGLPPDHHSWSAEFDEEEIAQDFWGDHWRPSFDGMSFVEAARTYLDDHPDIPRRSIRIQELGLLRAWYDATPRDTIILGKFATRGTDLVEVPTASGVDETFDVGHVYVVPGMWPSDSRDAKTCLAAMKIDGMRGYLGARDDPDLTVVQWSDGTLSAYTEEQLEGDRKPTPLTSAELSSTSLSTA